jgi:hypothetical protein
MVSAWEDMTGLIKQSVSRKSRLFQRRLSIIIDYANLKVTREQSLWNPQ